MPDINGVHDLARLTKQERPYLKRMWQQWFKSEPPARLSQSLLQLGIAWQMQAQQYGTSWQLGSWRVKRTTAVRPGTRFIREWHGTVHTVEAVPDGFLWQGQCYRSLSAIARAITGMRWSGPKFFGLKDAA